MISIPVVYHNHSVAFRPHTIIPERSAKFGGKSHHVWDGGYCMDHLVIRAQSQTISS